MKSKIVCARHYCANSRKNGSAGLLSSYGAYECCSIFMGMYVDLGG